MDRNRSPVAAENPTGFIPLTGKLLLQQTKQKTLEGPKFDTERKLGELRGELSPPANEITGRQISQHLHQNWTKSSKHEHIFCQPCVVANTAPAVSMRKVTIAQNAPHW
jgi:hypothetical protein